MGYHGYFIYLETGIESVFQYILSLNGKYLPKLVVVVLVDRQLCWYNHQQKLCHQSVFILETSFKSLELWQTGLGTLQEKVEVKWKESLVFNRQPHGMGERDDPDREICSFCNLSKTEYMKHFISSCFILSELRVANFGSEQLPPYVINMLNATNWLAFSKYCEAAWAYRKELVAESNWPLY